MNHTLRVAVASALIALPFPAAVAAQGKIELPLSLAELQQRAVADSNDAVAHYNLALGNWNAKKWDDVQRSLDEALRLDPRLAVAWLARSELPFARKPKIREEIFAATGELPAEYIEILRATDRDSRHAFMIDPMVDLRIMATTTSLGIDLGLFDDAIGSVDGNYLQAIVDCFEGHSDLCEQRLNRVINDYEDLGLKHRVPDVVYLLKGLAAARTGRHDAAIKDFEKLLSREEDRKKRMNERDLVRVPLQSNEYRFLIASVVHASGQTADAVKLYREAAENDLGLYMAHVRMANIYESQRDYPRAIEERNRAVNANPDDGTLHLELGITLGKSGNFAGAEDACRRATERIPRHAEAWFWLGLALEQQGKRDEARAAYQKVVELAPSRLKARATVAAQKVAALQ
ncbi:MAG: tetratricopeptide repeat protein [Gemmatimonadales bacterium]|nr:tetratricopeptide repeat protein [Gemmatimonadales bacterium]